MSAVVFDRVGFETEARKAVPLTSPRPREEEFRAALERYMADYIACQKRCAEARNSAPPRDQG